ncbi:MAG TPA: ABC transporter permease [Chloroflexota bacterium]|nr:ABC transporter permease [Chloroflexota bacterium]
MISDVHRSEAAPPAEARPPEPRGGAPPIYDSARRQDPFWEELIEAWRYRALVVQLVDRDVKVRYKRSLLGVAWTMVNPLITMGVLTIVFSHLFRFDVPNYPVYMLSANVLWLFFSQSTVSAMNQLMAGGALLTRIYVPRTLFGLAAVGTGLVNLVLSLVPLAAIVLLTGWPITPAVVWIVPAMVLASLFTLGIGLLLSSLAVLFPDVKEMYEALLPAWFFLTPVMYPASILPEGYREWLALNPMVYLVDAFRTPLYAGTAPSLETLLAAAVAAVVTLVVGWAVFTARADQMVYRL